jgi:hypothetical protein
MRSSRAFRRLPGIAAIAALGASVGAAAVAPFAHAQGQPAARPEIFEPGIDPALGVNLVSFSNNGPEGVGIFERGVQDIFDHGIRTVIIVASRFVNPTTGAIREEANGTRGPALVEIRKGVELAVRLGMTVTVSPFVEVDNFAFFRGQLRLSGEAADRFFDDYEAYMVEVAQLAQSTGANRMTLGSELRDLTTDPALSPRWSQVIAAADAVFTGELGYAANFDEYRNPVTTAVFWENPAIDFLGVDAYNQLANDEQARGPGLPGVATLEQAWNDVFDRSDRGFAYGILEFAKQLRGGRGLPVLLTEHGTIPFDRTTTQPFSNAGRNTEPPDPLEQRNDYEALTRASNGRAAVDPAQGKLTAIYLWRWSVGTDGDAFILHPEGDDIREGAMAARFVEDYVNTAR